MLRLTGVRRPGQGGIQGRRRGRRPRRLADLAADGPIRLTLDRRRILRLQRDQLLFFRCSRVARRGQGRLRRAAGRRRRLQLRLRRRALQRRSHGPRRLVRLQRSPQRGNRLIGRRRLDSPLNRRQRHVSLRRADEHRRQGRAADAGTGDIQGVVGNVVVVAADRGDEGLLPPAALLQGGRDRRKRSLSTGLRLFERFDGVRGGHGGGRLCADRPGAQRQQAVQQADSRRRRRGGEDFAEIGVVQADVGGIGRQGELSVGGKRHQPGQFVLRRDGLGRRLFPRRRQRIPRGAEVGRPFADGGKIRAAMVLLQTEGVVGHRLDQPPIRMGQFELPLPVLGERKEREESNRPAGEHAVCRQGERLGDHGLRAGAGGGRGQPRGNRRRRRGQRRRLGTRRNRPEQRMLDGRGGRRRGGRLSKQKTANRDRGERHCGTSSFVRDRPLWYGKTPRRERWGKGQYGGRDGDPCATGSVGRHAHACVGMLLRS